MKFKKWVFVILVLSLSVFSFKSLLRPGYFPMHDDMQAMRVLQMDKCIKDGQIPCRWVPDMGYGYGYPQFIYYSPLPYYVMEIFHLAGMQIIDSVKAGIVLGFLLSGLAMYLLGRSLWGDLGGLVSAIFYLYAPYHASDIYTRGAMGEFWALVFLPLIFWAILEYIKTKKDRYRIFLSLSIAGLLTTHNITSLIFAPMAILWAVFLLWYFQKKNLWLKLGLAGFWGVGLAAFFVLPAVFEKKFAHVETMTMGYFNYLAHFVSVGQLFLSNHWGFGSSELGLYDDLSFSIGGWHWIFALLSLVSAIVYWQRKKERSSLIVIFLFIIGLFSIFMTHQRSVFLWNNIKVLAYLQFPWRFLTLIIFFLSLTAGFILFVVKRSWQKTFLGAVMILGVIFLNWSYFRPRVWYQITDKDKFSGSLWEKQLTISIFDYLPIFATAPPSEKAPDQPVFLQGSGSISEFVKGSNWQKGKINVNSKAILQLPLYYFPGMTAWVDNGKIAIDHQNYLGLITFEVPAGEHYFSVKLQRTPIRLIGDLFTFLSLFGLVWWLAYVKNNKSY